MALNGRLVHERFFASAALHGDRPALRFLRGGGWMEWSYRELAAQARESSEILRGAGLRAGEPVGVGAARQPETIAALISILECGAHYLPLDPDYPEPRRRMLCAAAGVRTILPLSPAAARSAARAPAGAPPELSEESPAYLLFTSGSTGVPKGVLVPHRAVVRLVDRPNFMRLDASRVFLTLAPFGFDASTLEIWGPLLNGGTCVLYPDRMPPTSAGLRAVLSATGVNCLWLTSSLFNSIVDLDPSCLTGVEELLIGGEALSVPHVRRALAALPATQIINGYGPTENTTFTACYRIPRDFAASEPRVPIGSAVTGTSIAIVDEQLRPVAPGAEGELIAWGDGLALGYLNQPDLTRERFVSFAAPDGRTVRAYRTGDRARLRADGALDCLGRNDDQLKIDGHRIEPGEIERVIAALPGVQEVRVLARLTPSGHKRLAAYVVASDPAVAQTLRQRLAAELPAFLVPHFFHFLPALPLNAQGKLDRAALPDPFASAAPDTATGGNPLLAAVAAAWRQILGRHTASVDLNFFDAGGTSLEAVQLLELLSARQAQTLEPTFTFEHATIRLQAEALAAGAAPAPSDGRGQMRRDALGRDERRRA